MTSRAENAAELPRPRAGAPAAAGPRGLAARIAALPQARQDQLRDAGLAVAVAAISLAAVLAYHSQLHPLWLATVLVLAQGVPLAWRRTWPIGAGLLIGAARVAYDRIGFGFAPFPLGPAVAFYTIIDRCGPVRRWIACGLLIAGIVVSETAPGHNEPYDAMFQAVIFLAAWAAGTLSRNRRAHLLAAERRAQTAVAESDSRAIAAAAAERVRIARELHDVVAHHVSLIAVQAEAASAVLPDSPQRAATSVEVIGSTARQALAELRRLLGVLRSPGPAAPVPTAPSVSLSQLGLLLDQVRQAGLPVELDVAGTPCQLAPGVDLTAYRIVQEALTNTLRHTSAASAAVTLTYEPGFVTVRVSDTGPRRARSTSCGPAVPPGLAGAGGLGLAGIAERVASCGGSLAVGPTPADGFAVTARLPAL